MELSVALDTVCRLIVRARELEAEAPALDADDEPGPEDAGDNPAALDEEADDAIEAELLAALEDLADDEIADVLALAWIGHGTYDPSEWDVALEQAREDEAARVIDQLLDMPMLAADLEAGLAAFDLSCDEADQVD